MARRTRGGPADAAARAEHISAHRPVPAACRRRGRRRGTRGDAGGETLMAAPAKLWRIRRIYLDRIGSPAARFREVWLDLTGRDGTPLDTILWMRNGGGKSTLIALVCALIRPDRRDFLATGTTGRHLEDAILGSDTAHVVVEWIDPTGQRLVTGGVYEWADRAQPSDPNAAHERLRQTWYTFTPADGVELEQLPYGSAELKDFAKAVEALPYSCEMVVTSKQERWAQALQDRGLDPGLFTAILKINATEGGIEHHFKFKTADEFVQYLLTLVTEPTSAGKVAAILRTTRDRLARQPRLRAEVAFCDEAATLLVDGAAARDALVDAELAARAARLDAAGLAGALSAAVQAAVTVAERQDAIAGEASAGVLRAAAESATLDAHVRHYRWRAAQLVHERAAAAARAAESLVAERRHAHRSWQLVPTLIRHVEQAQRLEVARRRQEQAEAGAAPLRRERADAAAVLLAVLRNAADELDARMDTFAHEASSARERQVSARSLADSLRGRLGSLDAQQRTLEAQVGAFNSDLAAAAGHLGDDDLDVALAKAQRAEAAAAHTIEHELPADAARLDTDRRAYERDRAEAQTTLTELLRDKAVLDAERGPLLAEIEALGTDPRLTALAEQDRVDPIASQRFLTDLLTEAVITADRHRIQLAVADAEDDRAVQALASPRGLLPAALDLARAADVLAAARIPASTGWHFLADSVSPSAWPAVIADAPHLVGGLLVHDPDDLERARTELVAAQLFATSAIQVATTADLRSIVDADPGKSSGFVLPPASAMYDRTAAASESDRRNRGRDERNQRVHELLEMRDRDIRLRGQLLDLVAHCPSGHREHLDAAHSNIEEALAAVQERLAGLQETRLLLDERAALLEHTRRDLAERRRVLTIRIAALADLTRRAPDVAQMRTELSALPTLRAQLHAEMATAEEAERTAATAANRLAADAERAGSTVREYKIRCEELQRIASEIVVTARPNLTEATNAYQAAHDAYVRQTSGSALEATIAEITSRLAALDEEIQQFAAAERATAQTLLDESDPAAVRRAIEQAEHDFLTAQRDATLAGAALSNAHAALQACAPSTLDLAVDDDDVVRLAEQAQRGLDESRTNEQAARERASTAEAAAVTARRRADDFQQLVTDLTEDTDAIAGAADVAAFAGDVDAARESARAARRALQAADRAVNAARNRLNAEAHRIDRWALDERFATVSPEVRDRFREGRLDFDTTEQLAAQLLTYRHGLAGELDAVEKDKHLVVTALCAEVREGLKTLQRAQHHAQLPPGLADHLRNRRFLDVGPRSSVDTSDATLRSRVERLVDKLVAGKDPIPDGLTLAWEAIAAVVGRGNFVARVLKPSTELTDDRQPVELMSKWSGGEKVTIGLLLFCMLARLRAANRGGDVPGLGVLPMDNPLGTANYVAFLDLQRRVAAANGIQLIFLSGLGDMRAVGRFPNVVRMRNTHNRGRNYARVMDRELNEDQILESITTARLTFPVQGTLL
ncbi:hypothetical protein Dvina_02040 [Dactylosporangium vinaceum]|nr:hypothetical protein [Dactylosporangium vinaceum]UAB97017.1 hypothetical protein Dvina_02040 [Dactylosporangium vinaceum]